MRKWLIWFGILFLLILIFIPQIASTAIGKPLFVRALAKKSQADVQVDSLKLSWFGPQVFQGVSFQRDAVSGSFQELIIEAPFWKFSGAFQLKKGEISYQGGKVEQVEGQIVGNDFTLTGITLQGHISLKGQVYSKLHFHVQIDIKQFPLIVIDQKLDALLGPTLDLFGTISMDEGKGNIDLSATAANGQTHLKGILTEQGMTLSAPLDASIRLTPEMSALLLKDANPLFVTGVSSANPVRLHIEPDGFFFPLPFSLVNLKVGNATLDLGKVRCQNGESLQTIVALLKADLLTRAPEMNAWFTPVSFQISGGVLKAGRMDALLADSIHICTWGKIDLVKDKLDMILGLPADALEKAFGIKDLPKNYVLKIPVKGTTKKPEIDKTAAAAKIAGLIAIPKTGIFEGLFSKKEEKDIPKPIRPFPWE
ncbi:MAG: hypothetical protein K1X28_00830 [Parachlamydiales bacterium]|nr:hypothetical protein [Parachlamydiales bacterium]